MLGEEDVAKDHAADRRVGIGDPSGPRPVGLGSGQQVGFVGHAVGRTPDRPCLADPQLDVFVEEAAADERVPGDVDVPELLGVLRLEEEGLAWGERLEAVRRGLPEIRLGEVAAVAEEGRPSVVRDTDDDLQGWSIGAARRVGVCPTNMSRLDETIRSWCDND